MKRPGNGKNEVRRMLLILVATAALCAGVAVWVLWPYVMANEPSPDRASVDALNRLVSDGQPGGENGWDELRRFLVEELGSGQTPTPLGEAVRDPWTDPMEVLNHPWGDPRLSAHRETLEKVRPHLSVLDRVAARDRFFIPYRGDGLPLSDAPDAMPVSMEPPTQGLSGLRRLVLWNTVAMREAAERGDWEVATDRLRVALAAAQRTSRQALFIEWLIGMSLHGIPTLELRRELNEYDVPPKVCEEWLSLLNEHGWPLDQVDRVVEGEAIFGRSFYRGLFSDSGVPLRWRFERYQGFYESFFGAATAERDGPPSWRERLGNVRAVRDLRMDEVEAMHAVTVDRTRAILKGEPQRSRMNDSDEERWSLDLSAPSGIAEMMEDSVGTTKALRGQLMMTAALEAGTRVMLRLEIFHAAHGRWPATLVEAMDEADALDPSSGVPFEYEVSDDEWRPYVLRLGRSAERRGLGLGPTEFEINPVRPGGELAGEDRDEWEDEAAE